MQRTPKLVTFCFCVLSSLIVCLETLAADTADKQIIKVGALFPLSSWAAVAGQSELDSIRLAVKEINEAGGVRGKQLKLIVEDNRSSFKHTTTAFNKLVNVDRVSYVLGPSWAEFSEVVAPLAQSYGVVMITPSGYSKTLVLDKDFVFTLWPNFEVQTKPFAEFIHKQGHRKIALINTINTYADGISEAVTEQLQLLGTTVEFTESFNPDELDYRSAIRKLQKNGADAVIIFLLENGENASFLRQAKDLQLQAQIYGSPTLPYDHIIMHNKKVADGVIFFDYLFLAQEGFARKYEEFSSAELVYSYGRAYDSAFLLKRAIEKCGEKAELVKSCLAKEDYQGVSGRIRFDKQGNIVPGGRFTTLRKGVKGEFVEIK